MNFVMEMSYLDRKYDYVKKYSHKIDCEIMGWDVTPTSEMCKKRVHAHKVLVLMPQRRLNYWYNDFGFLPKFCDESWLKVFDGMAQRNHV